MTDGKKPVKKNVAPCMGCGMRFPGCHAICLRFGVWREGLDKINEEEKAERTKQSDVTKVINNGFEKTRFAQVVRKRGKKR